MTHQFNQIRNSFEKEKGCDLGDAQQQAIENGTSIFSEDVTNIIQPSQNESL